MIQEPTTTTMPEEQRPLGTPQIALANNRLKEYFEKVIELQKLNEPFPVDLDLVWPIAYTRRDSCTKELTKNFIESIDYQILRRKAEQDKPRQNDTYHLSVSCMEYLIVRKVRPVFDVYRKMFKAAVEQLSPVNEEITNYTSAVFDDTQPLNKESNKTLTNFKNKRSFV